MFVDGLGKPGDPDGLSEMLVGRLVVVESATNLAVIVYAALVAPRNTVMSDGVKVEDSV